MNFLAHTPYGLEDAKPLTTGTGFSALVALGDAIQAAFWGVRKKNQEHGKRRVQTDSSSCLELNIIKKATLFNGFLTFILRRKKTRESF